MRGVRGSITIAGLFALLLLLALFINVFGFSLQQLGLSRLAAFLLLASSLAGSVVNIPLYQGKAGAAAGEPLRIPWRYFRPPELRRLVIAVNLGGAVIPLGFAIYLLTLAPLAASALVFVIVAIACKLIAKHEPEAGVSIWPVVPPLLAAALAFVFARQAMPPVTYIGGTLGTLMGADLLNLPAVLRSSDGTFAIGGAGVFDAIFLVGLMALILS